MSNKNLSVYELLLLPSTKNALSPIYKIAYKQLELSQGNPDNFGAWGEAINELVNQEESNDLLTV